MERRTFLGSVIGFCSGLAFKAEPVSMKLIDPYDRIKLLSKIILATKDDLLKLKLGAKFNYFDLPIIMPGIKDIEFTKNERGLADGRTEYTIQRKFIAEDLNITQTGILQGFCLLNEHNQVIIGGKLVADCPVVNGDTVKATYTVTGGPTYGNEWLI